MKIRLKFNDQVVGATLVDSEAAHAFVAMLPLTITMHDIFRREKFGALPRPVGLAPTRSQPYEVGDLVCWSAGPDLAVMHAQDGTPLTGGFHFLGHLDSGAEAFATPGPLDITIELQTVPKAAAPIESLAAGC